MATLIDNANASAEYTTTDGSYHVAVDYSVATFSNHLPGVLYGEAIFLCRDPNTNASAFWVQPFGVKFDTDSAQAVDQLPALLTSKKETALLLTDVAIGFNGENIELKVKGLSGHTLKWIAALYLHLGMHDDS